MCSGKRETGENPVRSRHCDSEQAALPIIVKDKKQVTGDFLREGAVSIDLKSGNLLILCCEILAVDEKYHVRMQAVG